MTALANKVSIEVERREQGGGGGGEWGLGVYEGESGSLLSIVYRSEGNSMEFPGENRREVEHFRRQEQKWSTKFIYHEKEIKSSLKNKLSCKTREPDHTKKQSVIVVIFGDGQLYIHARAVLAVRLTSVRGSHAKIHAFDVPRLAISRFRQLASSSVNVR